MAYRTGIHALYYSPISTGKVEGINNKMKVMKRVAYDFRGEKYFHLRLYVLHDCRITPNVGWTNFDERIEQKIFHAEIVVDSAKISTEMRDYQPIPVIADFQNEDGPIISKKLSKPTTNV